MATKRGYYLEELTRSVDNIEMSLTHLARVIDAYKDPHPEISQAVAECGNVLVKVAENILKIKEAI
jgi:hypothetical protein